MVGERPGCAPAASGTRPASSATTPSLTSTALGRALRAGRARLPGRGRRSRVAGGAPVLVRVTDADGAGARARRARCGVLRRASRLAAPRRAPRRGARSWARACTPCARDLTPAHFVEIGIGCESCHGGSREHIRSDRGAARLRAAQRRSCASRPPPGAASRRAPRRSTAPARAATRCCSRATPTPGRAACAAAGRPPTGRQLHHLGRGARLPARRLRAPMACTTCHDPHGEDRRDKLERAATPAGNHVCTSCHARYAAPEALRAHAHHDPAGAGGACVALPHAAQEHGPRLSADALPPHRLAHGRGARRARPPARVRALPRRQQRRELVGDMERLWGKHYDRAALARSTAAISNANALLATLEHGKPHEQAAAMAVLGEQRVRRGAAADRAPLVNPIPLVRYYARRALDAIRGAPRAVDLDRPTPEIEAAARRCVPAAWPASATPPPATRAGAGVRRQRRRLTALARSALSLTLPRRRGGGDQDFRLLTP